MVFELNHQDPLCVPEDNLEDLEFFPNFSDDLIKLTGQMSGDEDDFFSWKTYAPSQPKPETEVLREYSLNPKVIFSGQEQEFEQAYEFLCGRGMGARKNLLGERRRCSHCETEKTPQWRMGPNRPRSLCNACGMRYKTGRLVPEYRPAASPSFDSKKHSNFHRNIVEKKTPRTGDAREV